MKNPEIGTLFHALPAPVQSGRGEGRMLGKKQALVQIHEFMDSYQKDMIGRLTAHSVSPFVSQSEAAQTPSCANDDQEPNTEGEPNPKRDRERLHRIWLAMKPTFRPATTF